MVALGRYQVFRLEVRFAASFRPARRAFRASPRYLPTVVDPSNLYIDGRCAIFTREFANGRAKIDYVDRKRRHPQADGLLRSRRASSGDVSRLSQHLVDLRRVQFLGVDHLTGELLERD